MVQYNWKLYEFNDDNVFIVWWVLRIKNKLFKKLFWLSFIHTTFQHLKETFTNLLKLWLRLRLRFGWILSNKIAQLDSLLCGRRLKLNSSTAISLNMIHSHQQVNDNVSKSLRNDGKHYLHHVPFASPKKRKENEGLWILHLR